MQRSPGRPARRPRRAGWSAALPLDAATAEAVRLAVSELVSNAVMHGTGAIIVTLANEPEGCGSR